MSLASSPDIPDDVLRVILDNFGPEDKTTLKHLFMASRFCRDVTYPYYMRDVTIPLFKEEGDIMATPEDVIQRLQSATYEPLWKAARVLTLSVSDATVDTGVPIAFVGRILQLLESVHSLNLKLGALRLVSPPTSFPGQSDSTPPPRKLQTLSLTDTSAAFATRRDFCSFLALFEEITHLEFCNPSERSFLEAEAKKRLQCDPYTPKELSSPLRVKSLTLNNICIDYTSMCMCPVLQSTIDFTTLTDIQLCTMSIDMCSTREFQSFIDKCSNLRHITLDFDKVQDVGSIGTDFIRFPKFLTTPLESLTVSGLKIVAVGDQYWMSVQTTWDELAKMVNSAGPTVRRISLEVHESFRQDEEITDDDYWHQIIKQLRALGKFKLGRFPRLDKVHLRVLDIHHWGPDVEQEFQMYLQHKWPRFTYETIMHPPSNE